MRFKHLKDFQGNPLEIEVAGEGEVDAAHLTALPALFDPHVHFRTPGHEYKEDWKSAALAAIRSGVTGVADMPNNVPSCVTKEALIAKKQLINQQLKSVDIPLDYHLYLGADRSHLSEIERAKDEYAAIKVFMGSSTGSLLIDDEKTLDEVFKRAKQVNKPVAVHAEDEALLIEEARRYVGERNPAMHSVMRPIEAARRAAALAIEKAIKYDVTLYLLHLSTEAEMQEVIKGREAGAKLFAEATPHHLFLDTSAYDALGTGAQVNPPLREEREKKALWEALLGGVIDTIGTDHAPHTSQEKKQEFGKAPSGMPSIEFLLPLLLNAVYEKTLSLEKVVELSSKAPRRLFSLPSTQDYVIVDLEMKQRIEPSHVVSKSGWTPYLGKTLVGWPLYTILGGRCYPIKYSAKQVR